MPLTYVTVGSRDGLDIREYLANTPEDLASLPTSISTPDHCALFSTCVVKSDLSVRRLSSGNVWELMTGDSSSLEEAKEYADDLCLGKVDKVTGKGLSTNDFTTTEKKQTC